MLSVSLRASRTALISCLLLWGPAAVALHGLSENAADASPAVPLGRADVEYTAS